MTARLLSATLISLALLLGIETGTAVAVPNGAYKGKTEGKVGVTVKVKNNRIKKFTSSVYATCYSYSGLQTVAFPPAGRKGAKIKIKASGSFKVVFSGDPGGSPADDKRTLKGKFKGGKVTGSMKIEGLCSGKATFKAHK
ncbi:MAG: hypothetical protein IPK93_08540 [Solirubrobacterales bacterium]|nr:hypothetical protein [Solirubrobacterales bacterium]